MTRIQATSLLLVPFSVRGAGLVACGDRPLDYVADLFQTCGRNDNGVPSAAHVLRILRNRPARVLPQVKENSLRSI